MGNKITKPGDGVTINCPANMKPLITVFENVDTGEVECAMHSPCPATLEEQVGVLTEAIRKLRLHHAARAPQVVNIDLVKTLWDGGVRETPHHRIRPTMPVRARRT